MKKRLFALLMALTAALILLGCGTPAATDAPAITTGAVSYLGPTGTYTEEAAQCFFGTDRELLPQTTVAEAVDRLLDGSCVYAVIPQENTLGGPVYNYVDELLAHPELSVVGEVELPIRQALLTAEGTKAEDITVVYSHQQGILQGQAWLTENLPQAEVVEVSSTAEGARMVAESGGTDCAAIASTGAAAVYGLEVFAENIQQTDANRTRFYVLSLEEPAELGQPRMLFTATGDAAGLPELLRCMERTGLSPIFLHDRPEKTELGSYIYLIECEDAGYDEYEKISTVPDFGFHYYGAFPVLQP